MKKFILFVVAMCTMSAMKAQFSTSTRLYFYEFVESVDNGMKSYSKCTGGSDYYFALFKNGMLGIKFTNRDEIASHALKNDVNEFFYKAIIAYANFLDSEVAFSYGTHFDFDFPNCFKYNIRFSTGSKYTYRQIKPEYIVDQTNSYGQPTKAHWSTTKYTEKDECYTFSLDRKEMIRWRASNPNKRDYYKLVDVNSLKPNTDFLY